MIKRYLIEYKELMQEWDYEANKDLDPTKLTVGSKENVLWKCSKCGYHWHAMINGRYSNHTGCPVCANKVFAKGYNDLETIHPEIAKEWHPTMNGNLTPSDVKPASLNRVWWLCPICNNAYQKRIMDRVKKGSKCNKCCDPKVIQGKNDIATKFPDLLREWNYEKNYPFLPQNFSYGSKRKFWWKCSKCGYEWEATAIHRAKSGSGCPVCKKCSGAIKGLTDLVTTHPELAKEWDYENNKNLTPEQVKAGSGKNVWWKCPKCHCSYKTQIIARVKGRGCLNCNDTGVADGFNDFQTLYPNLVKEWHPTKNTKKPNQIKSKSKYNAFWICPTCGLVWQAPVVSRVVQGRNCPACNDTALVPGVNDLATKFPEIAKEWHPTKNGDLTPKDVKYGSRKKVWWKCKICGKEWETTIDSRTRQLSGCPRCLNSKQTSYPEQAIYYYVQQIYPDAINKYKAEFLGRMELDIFIPSINFAIEYDGEAWHRENKRSMEQRKYKLCQQKGIKLIRIREKLTSLGCEISDDQIGIVKLNGKNSLEETIKYLINKINFAGKHITVDLTKDEMLIRSLCHGNPKDSLEKLFPELASEWHPTLNKDLKPDNVSCGSNLRVWWLCPKCSQSYKASISHRVKDKSGCPVCSNKKVVIGINDLFTTNPDLANEWHPTKNGSLTPHDVTYGSGKKIWWLCPKCKHEWFQSVNRRTSMKLGCPCCTGKKLIVGKNDLATECPELAKEWHQTKNGNLSPKDVKAGSHFPVWWKCSVCGNEWKTDIRSRVKGRKCPNCSKKQLKLDLK